MARLSALAVSVRELAPGRTVPIRGSLEGGSVVRHERDGAIALCPRAVSPVLERTIEDPVDEAVGAVIRPRQEQDLEVHGGDDVADLRGRLAIEVLAAEHVGQVDEALHPVLPGGLVEPLPVRRELAAIERFRVDAAALEPADVRVDGRCEHVAAEPLEAELARRRPEQLPRLLQLALHELARLVVDKPATEAALVPARPAEHHATAMVTPS